MRGIEKPWGPEWSQCIRPLGSLDVDSAREIFLSIADCPKDDPAIDKLARAVDFLPLPVTILAQMAQYQTLDFLSARFLEEGISMLSMGNDKLSDMMISIDASIQGPRIAEYPGARLLLRRLADMGDLEWISNSRVNLLESCPEFRGSSLKKYLSILKRTSLLDEDRSGYRLPALVQSYLAVVSDC
jgi:hypothetical protein